MKLLLSLLCLLASLQATERTRVMMGTFATVSVPDTAAGCIDGAFAAMTSVEKALSSYDPAAEVYRLNHAGALAISPTLYDALQSAVRYYVQSDGYFDITIGALSRGAYHFGEAERVPGRAEIAGLPIGLNLLEFNATAARLAPGAMLDFGGFGKGVGLDAAAAVLRHCGVTEGTVALSGDIRCLGRCLLAIQDPFSEGTLMTFKSLAPQTGMSTSGDYRRFVGDKTHNHLIDPKTRASERAFASITLVGTVRSGDLDAWTTAAAVMPPPKAVAFLRTLPVGYVLIYSDGTVVKSANLSHYLEVLEGNHEDD
ncbi:FAD:protein FMN transferase [Sulfurimonas sp. HSL-3221]|uniref:FAD:protein FMN transferase n=1 Tax=Sulfurimonadaceae TaxID=2771471 RepID=UPI001E56CC39|nr:FAD:protein FMN transferase [Sulfurimonas sp. HSL-3221]UFS61364.1 FAD:protein FMN transferase [Sulfurimonas sp. HSL-3221]